MMDGGSSTNVCLLKVLVKLGLTATDLKPSYVIIKTYDDTKRSVEGIFEPWLRMDLSKLGSSCI